MAGDRDIVFHLTVAEASVAKAMLARGDGAFDVAYWFGVAEEEIEQLANGSIFPGAEAADSEALPPSGPYPPIRAVRSAVAAIERALDDLNVARAAVGLQPWVFSFPALATDPRRGRASVPEGETEETGARPRGPRRSAGKPAEPKPERPKYQPPGQRLPGTKIAPQPGRPETERDRASPIQVRLLMERGGFCRVTLLPRRTSEMPVEVEVAAGGEPLALTQLQEEWFEDVHPADLGILLRDGTAWTAALPDGQNLRWVLSGREVYVLGHHPQLSGFVSAPKILLGELHVVLCTANILPHVKRVIGEGGSPSPVILGSGAGIPDGWVGLQGVRPQIALASMAEADILNVLRAEADLRIVHEGGIRIARSSWLLGHPPKIRISGQQAAGDKPSIDGKRAQPDAEGYLVSESADQLGQHTVSCGNISRVYSIAGGLERWEPWDAYCWSMGDLTLDERQRHPAICGPLARAPITAPNGSQVVLVPPSNELLLGATPGEIDRSDPRTDIGANKGIALPWFNAVWAMPADILHCNKRNAKLLFVGDRSQLHALQPGQRGGTSSDVSPGTRKEHVRRVIAWCTTILNAGRKGLQIEPLEDDITALWLAYRRCARSIWRSLR